MAAGAPAQVVTAELVEGVFGLPCRVVADPETGTQLVVPRRPRSVSRQRDADRADRDATELTNQPDQPDQPERTDDRTTHALV